MSSDVLTSSLELLHDQPAGELAARGLCSRWLRD